MSSLWSARVEEVGGATVVLHVMAVHPDAGDLSEDPVFAARLLADGLAQAAGDTERAGELDARADAGTAGEVIAAVSVSARRHFPFRESVEKDRIAAALRDRGLDPGDGSAWQDAFQEEWRALWKDPRRLPQANLTVRLRDADLLGGLRVGHGWESAAYS